MIAMIVLKKMTGLSMGRVTLRKRRRPVAPSISAASYKSLGMPFRPAR